MHNLKIKGIVVNYHYSTLSHSLIIAYKRRKKNHIYSLIHMRSLLQIIGCKQRKSSLVHSHLKSINRNKQSIRDCPISPSPLKYLATILYSFMKKAVAKEGTTSSSRETFTSDITRKEQQNKKHLCFGTSSSTQSNIC